MNRVDVVVDNRIRIPQDERTAPAITKLKDLFEHENPEIATKRAIGITTYGLSTTLRTWRAEGDEFSLPRGGMARLRNVFAEMGVAYRAIDNRSEGAPSPSFPKYIGKPLRPFQSAAMAKILEREQGIVRAPTGGGKTILAFAAVAEVGLNALVILPTKGLFNQWAMQAEKELGLAGDRLGMIGNGKRRLRPLTIAMQQTLWRMTPEEDPDVYRDYFGFVLSDEAQLLASRTMQETLNRFHCRYRLAVSADERRKDKLEVLTHDLFGDVIYEIGRDAVEDAGHIVDVEMRVVPTDFDAPWYGVGPGRTVDFNRLLDEMVNDEDRNALALRFVHEELHAGEQAIMLTGRREHTRTLERDFVAHQIPSGYLLGEQVKGDAEEFSRTRAGLIDGTTRVGIGTYKALGYGIDLPAVSVGMAVTPISSNAQQTNQVRGRLCRVSEGKKQGRLYVLWDVRIYPKHLDIIIANNRNVVVFDRESWVDARAWRKKNKKRLVRQ